MNKEFIPGIDDLPENVVPMDFAGAHEGSDAPPPDEDTSAPDEEPYDPEPVVVELTMYQLACPYCGKQQMIELQKGLTDNQLRKEAVRGCDCVEAKLEQQGSTMHKKIDAMFGPDSVKAYGFSEECTDQELSIIKMFGAEVVKRNIKAVTITLNNDDKAVIQIVKDATKVSHKETTKAESNA